MLRSTWSRSGWGWGAALRKEKVCEHEKERERGDLRRSVKLDDVMIVMKEVDEVCHWS